VLKRDAKLQLTHFLRIFPVRLSGTLGHWLCVLLYGETVLWIGLNGSMLNLAAITVERYVKIVHSAWYKKRCRPWMVYPVTRTSASCKHFNGISGIRDLRHSS